MSKRWSLVRLELVAFAGLGLIIVAVRDAAGNGIEDSLSHPRPGRLATTSGDEAELRRKGGGWRVTLDGREVTGD